MHTSPLPAPALPSCTPHLALRLPRKPTTATPQRFDFPTMRPYTSVVHVDGRCGKMSTADNDTTVGDDAPGRLRLNVVGKFSASVDGREVSLSRKAQALLGYMILS